MGATQGGLFCAIVQLMRTIKTTFLIAVLAAGPAMAQQPAAKTTEQQARSYITSAFITGAAPLILSDDVVVQPELRTKLALPADASSRTVYQALMNLTNGKAVQVRPAIRDEVLKSQVIAAPGKPVFALETGTTTLVMQYDLERDNVAFVGQPTAIAASAPVALPEAPKPLSDAPTAQAQAPAQPEPAPAANLEAAPAASAPSAETKPAVEAAPATPPAPAAAAPAATPEPTPAPVATPAPTLTPEPMAAPAAETPKPGLQIVEPQEPRAKPATAPAAKAQPAPAATTVARAREARPPLPKPNGPCAIKPVMSDQDLVNCGATPHY
jgi:hypothetical protein